MIKWAPIGSLVLFLVVLWTQDVMPAQILDYIEGAENDDGAIREISLENDMAEQRALWCGDRGCSNKNGKCGYYWFTKCAVKNSSLCSGICTCCINTMIA